MEIFDEKIKRNRVKRDYTLQSHRVDKGRKNKQSELQTSKGMKGNFTDNFMNFPAIRGVQAGKEFYVVMCKLRDIPKLFIFNEPEVPAELRAQRMVNKSRLPKLVSYVLENKDNYIFSAITASVDGISEFVPFEENTTIGNLNIPMDAKLLINDGQHRRAAIEKIIEEKPELGYESIPVVFFLDYGLSNSQQMFADLNRHTVRPTRSLSILYDHRNELSRKVLELINDVKFFRGRIEKEKTSLSNRTTKLFTLSAIYSANRHILTNSNGNVRSTDIFNFAVQYWNALFEQIIPWQEVSAKKISSCEFRKVYTCAHGVLLEAFGKIGRWIEMAEVKNWKRKIEVLRTIDYRKSNVSLWEGVCMNNGRMSKSFSNVNATYELLKNLIGRYGIE